jgi:hypothetical protein
MSEMTDEKAAQLREPFPPEKIGKLPRVTCGRCRESRERSCDDHRKSKCADCGSWVTSAHMHLDFVGHADATDRFLAVDPGWTWEPFALDGRGLPAFDDNGGIWIRLTIAGVTRIGYGDADGKKGANAIKEAIGDALRNAGLRFGVALDLWRKESAVEVSSQPRRAESSPSDEVAVPPAATAEQTAKHDALLIGLDTAQTEDDLKSAWALIVAAYKADEVTTIQANALRSKLDERKAEFAGTPT